MAPPGGVDCKPDVVAEHIRDIGGEGSFNDRCIFIPFSSRTTVNGNSDAKAVWDGLQSVLTQLGQGLDSDLDKLTSVTASLVSADCQAADDLTDLGSGD